MRLSPWRRLLSLCTLLVVAAAGRAQDVSIADQAEDGKQTCTVRMMVCAGSPQGGALGFVRVEIDCVDDRGHDFELRVGTPTWHQVDVSATRHLTLAAHERARFFMPLPTSMQPTYYRLLVDGRDHQQSLGAAKAAGVSALFVSERADAVPNAMAVLSQLAASARSTPTVTQCVPSDMPTDWRLLTAFHVVIVDGRAAIAGDLQEALRRLVFAGGTLVVAMPEKLPVGQLRDLLPTGFTDSVVRHGLGACVALPRLDAAPELMQRRLSMLPLVGQGPWPADGAITRTQFVPGLGQPPVLVFLSIIIAFAVLAGPVNLMWLRRRRQPLLLLVTMPVLGFGTTLAILAFGYVHDGVGTRGVVTSWSVLDQVRHEAAAVAARTLFAGLAPDDLQLTGDSFVTSPRATDSGRDAVDRWRLDLDTGRLDGGVLPSRTPTPLLARQQGLARERLRVRASGGGLEVLVDGGVEPIGTLLLRDFDGAYWIGQTTRLLPASADEAAAAMSRLRNQAKTASDLSQVAAPHTMPVEEAQNDAGPIMQRLFENYELAPGSYATMVKKAPWLDEHGLHVNYDLERHFVLGRMDAEDFLR